MTALDDKYEIIFIFFLQFNSLSVFSFLFVDYLENHYHTLRFCVVLFLLFVCLIHNFTSVLHNLILFLVCLVMVRI